MKKENGCIE
ncbi:Protein of unknown function [Bacillus mycoides]|nr:Protein of unknown function [Bacillus mycoides]